MQATSNLHNDRIRSEAAQLIALGRAHIATAILKEVVTKTQITLIGTEFDGRLDDISSAIERLFKEILYKSNE